MIKILVDTCVWLDLVKDPQQQKTLDVLEEIVRLNELTIIVPQLVIDEFNRNKDRVVKESTKSLSSVFKRVKDTVDKYGDKKVKKAVIDQLNDIDHKLPNLGESIITSVSRIEKILKSGEIIPTSDTVKILAAQRAIDKKAPFHREKNSINDAILMETYISYVKDKN